MIYSACGKVILFGEHAVVYSKHGIATAIDKRVQVRVDNSQELLLVLSDEKTYSFNGDVLDRLFTLEDIKAYSKDTSVVVFLYLAAFFNIRLKKFTVSSDLPIGAGLGSSAAYSTTLVVAMMDIQGYKRDADFAYKKALECERIVHGEASGLDNLISLRGGAYLFKKGIMPLRMQLPCLQLSIVDSLVKKDTKAMVERVKALKEKQPRIVESILEAIDLIVLEAKEALINGDVSILGDLMQINQGLLFSLGVSHPSLEAIISNAYGMKLKAKLTGAGGGGCVIVLGDYPGALSVSLGQMGAAIHDAFGNLVYSYS